MFYDDKDDKNDDCHNFQKGDCNHNYRHCRGLMMCVVTMLVVFTVHAFQDGLVCVGGNIQILLPDVR